MERISYEMLKNTAPYGLENPHKRRDSGKLTLWKVLCFFAVVMAVFIFVGGLAQYYLGMAGVVITELMFLAASVLFVYLQKASFREVFPIRRPRMLLIGATAVLWLASYLAMIIVNLIVAYFFPAEFYGASNSTNTLIASIPWGLAFLVIAILPAVCEEALHRGVIQFGVHNTIRKPWMIVLLMGLLFGVFHLSPTKFLPTALLGAAMSYLLLRTGNMVYSSFFHFLHNGIQMLILLPSFLPGAAVSGIHFSYAMEDVVYNSLRPLLSTSIGLYLCFGASIPFLLYLSHWMIVKSEIGGRISFLPWGKAGKKTLFWILFPTFLILAVGLIVLFNGTASLIQYRRAW